MLEQLKTVMAAVSNKDIIPALMHVAMHDGALHAYDGRVYMRVPCSVQHELAVPAKRLRSALELCGSHKLTMTATTDTMLIACAALKLSVKLPVMPVESFPFPPLIEGKPTKLTGSLYGALRNVRPFIGEDASRAWCASVLLRNKKAIATNNVVLVECVAPALPREIALHRDAVDTMLSIPIEPTHYLLNDNALELVYKGGMVVRSQLVADAWPSTDEILDRAHSSAKLKPVPEQLSELVEHVRTFCPDASYPVLQLEEKTIRTLEGATSASVAFSGLDTIESRYHADPLQAVLACATHADFTRYPYVPWKSDVLKGVLTGVKA